MITEELARRLQRGRQMPYALRCADSGMDCPAEFKTATESELMEVVKVHAPIAHPDLKLDEETVAMVQGLVREVP
jgi:predicted small metal-binding protein